MQTSENFWCQYFWTATSYMFAGGYVVLAQELCEARRRRLGVAMGPSPASDLVKFWPGTPPSHPSADK